ncbi:MAG: DUF2474 family protein [Beijerinckiaceae bacterium]|nr:DUF2474 family protein [Beijerinckiaceae bacterium]
MLKRIGWFLVLWSGGVASLAAVAFIIRLALAP